MDWPCSFGLFRHNDNVLEYAWAERRKKEAKIVSKEAWFVNVYTGRVISALQAYIITINAQGRGKERAGKREKGGQTSALR